MLKNACIFCKIVGAVAIIGALNLGLIGAFQLNLIDTIFGANLARIIYVLVGLSGIALLVSFFMNCRTCKK